MEHHFINYENEDSFVNKSGNTRQTICSFIGMKILASHSGFHDEYEDTSSICDSFLDFNKEFFGFIEPILKNDGKYYSEFYINFSITSLISICTMKYFERSVNFLRNLAMIKNDKYSFLSLHESHPKILMKCFLLVISYAISSRAPSHFFIKPELEEAEEEEEEAKENEEENDTASLFDNIEKLTSFIKEEYDFFNKLIGNSIPLKNQMEIIVRAITENGIFPITKESKTMIQKVFGTDFDFFNSDFTKQNLIQFHLSNHNSEALINTLIDFSQKFEDKLESFLHFSNPESYINNALSMKMGILIPMKCPKNHTGFLAANCINSAPMSYPNSRCYYCVGDLCQETKKTGNNYSNDENDEDDEFMLFSEIKKPESVILLNIYNIIDGLHPIEANFLRIILTAIKYKADLNSKEAQQQINISMCAIATLLFPFTSYILSKKVTYVFVKMLLQKFEAIYLSLFPDYHHHSPSPHEFRQIFSALISPTLKGVFENVVNKMKDDSFLGKKASKAKLSHISASPACCILHPMGSKYFLRSFLLDPLLRTRCPVIYAYLRLNDRFDRVRFIPKIVPFITRIFQYVDKKKGKNINNIRISQIKGCKELHEDWKMASEDVLNDLMTPEARKYLKLTLDDDPKVSSFMPVSHKNWPVMTVLLSCSEAQNKFISILNEYRNIVVKDINDTDVSTINDDFRLRNSFLNVPLLKAIKGNINHQGDVEFTKEHERVFCDELSYFSYNYIIHQSLSLKYVALKGADSLIIQFSNLISPKPLTFQQKHVISIIKKEGKGTGLALLLESLILGIIKKSSKSIVEGKKHIATVVQEFLSSQSKDFDISSLERDAFEAFMGLRGKSSDPFLIQQIPGIYNMLMSNVNESNEVQSYVISYNFLPNQLFEIEDSDFIDLLKTKALSDAEWLDMSCITLQLIAYTENNLQNEKNQTPFEIILKNKEKLTMSTTQEKLVLDDMRGIFEKISVDELNSLYMFCSKKTL